MGGLIPTIDWECYSDSGYRFDKNLGYFVPLLKNKPGLKCINAAVYAEHPSTRVISLAYDLRNGNGTYLWAPGMPLPLVLFDHIRVGGFIEAHNSIFEFYIWYHVACMRMGWPVLPLRQLICSMATSRAWGLPGGLDRVAQALGTVDKDKRGKDLIKLLCVPKRPTKKCSDLFRSREKYPELYQEMLEYNVGDVRAEMGISARIPALSPFELAFWRLDQEINMRGAAVDVVGLNNCQAIFEQSAAKYTEELQMITDGAVQSVDEITVTSAGGKWLAAQGYQFTSLDKKNVEAALKRTDLPVHIRRVLEIRQTLGAASVKKLGAMLRTLSNDGRIRDMFVYCGAERTGRFAGRGAQPQNLKNHGPDCHACAECGFIFAASQAAGVNCPKCWGVLEADPADPLKPAVIEWGNRTAKAALITIATRNLMNVEWQWGNALDVVTSCLRSLFIAATGHDLVCSDYSAIEAVVIAAMAREEWRLEVFRTHGKIYETSASKISGIPLEEILEFKERTKKHHPLRKKIGKIAELGSAYGGWIGAWKNFGADKFMTDDEIKTNILKWREESPAIVEFWGGQYRKTPGKWEFRPDLYGVEGAVIEAILNPGQCYQYIDVGFGYDQTQDVLYIRLPSGRKLSYHQPRMVRGVDKRKLPCWVISYMDFKLNTRIETWGSRLVENIVQAVSRDILACAMLRVSAAGYPLVLHVHDEMVAEVLKGFGSVEEFESLMAVREPWFADWPIRAAGGWRGKRFRK